MEKTIRKNKVCLSTIVLILFVIIFLTIPYVVIAEDTETYDKEVEYGTDSIVEFQYDGNKKVIKINNAPNDSGELITECYGPDVGDYKYKMGEEPDQTTLTVTIKKRLLIVKPVDVLGEYTGKNVMADSIEIVSGTSLVNDHYIDTNNIVYCGVASGIGKINTSISGEIKIYDSNNIDVTHNYEITSTEGYINLSQPFDVTVDPDEEGTLGGGNTANPAVANSSSGNSSHTSASDMPVSNLTEGTAATTIKEGDTPLASGFDSIPSFPGSSDERANTTAATAIFLAIFAVLAVIAISIIHIIRRKRIRENGSDWG